MWGQLASIMSTFQMSLPDTDFHSPNARLQLHIGNVADAEHSSIIHATKVISTACRTLQNTELHHYPNKSTKEPYMQNKNYTTKRGLALGHCKHYTTDNSNIYNHNNHNLMFK